MGCRPVFVADPRMGGCLVVVALRLQLPVRAAPTALPDGDPLDPGIGPPETGADLVGLDLGHRPPLSIWGLPGALPEPAHHHDPVPLAERVRQVGGLIPPGVDAEECGLAVSPGAALLDPLGDRDAEVDYRSAVVVW
jgi:hypothetical protein